MVNGIESAHKEPTRPDRSCLGEFFRFFPPEDLGGDVEKDTAVL
jgi:hypothetical protein